MTRRGLWIKKDTRGLRTTVPMDRTGDGSGGGILETDRRGVTRSSAGKPGRNCFLKGGHHTAAEGGARKSPACTIKETCGHSISCKKKGYCFQEPGHSKLGKGRGKFRYDGRVGPGLKKEKGPNSKAKREGAFYRPRNGRQMSATERKREPRRPGQVKRSC